LGARRADQTPEEIILHTLKHAGMRENLSQRAVLVLGADRSDLLHRLSTNDVLGVGVGNTVLTSFLTEKGRMIDCVVVLVRHDSLLVLPSESNEEGFTRWIERFIIMEDVTLRDIKGNYRYFSLLGPQSPAVIAEAFDRQIEPGTFEEVVTGGSSLILSRRGDFGIERVDCLVPSEASPIFQEQLKHITYLPVINDLAYETVRAVVGIPAYGHEICDEYNPYEIGLEQTLNFRKGCYVGQEVIARLDTYKKVQRRLIGLSFPGDSPQMNDHADLFSNGRNVGRVTTTGGTEVGGRRYGLAVVRSNDVVAGDRVWTDANEVGTGMLLNDLPVRFDVAGVELSRPNNS
jgi:folate-binding protein YgfZ